MRLGLKVSDFCFAANLSFFIGELCSRKVRGFGLWFQKNYVVEQSILDYFLQFYFKEVVLEMFDLGLFCTDYGSY